jgi:hypothetical protein
MLSKIGIDKPQTSCHTLKTMRKLTFAKGNAKLEKDTAIFSLPAGHTCPFAKDCFCKADRVTGKLTDGNGIVYRCYAASSENLFRNIRVSRWRNLEALRAEPTVGGMACLIKHSLPRKGIKLCRIHASGDFFSQAYFDAWMVVAITMPEITFYAYTKALPFWVARLGNIPSNMHLVASRGGKFDHLISEYKLRNVRVVFSESQASKFWRLAIDHNDKLAWASNDNFALLLHGTQPANTAASKALYKLRKQGQGGYKADYFAHYADKAKV